MWQEKCISNKLAFTKQHGIIYKLPYDGNNECGSSNKNLLKFKRPSRLNIQRIRRMNSVLNAFDLPYKYRNLQLLNNVYACVFVCQPGCCTSTKYFTYHIIGHKQNLNNFLKKVVYKWTNIFTWRLKQTGLNCSLIKRKSLTSYTVMKKLTLLNKTDAIQWKLS